MKGPSKPNSFPLCTLVVEPRAKLNRVHAVIYMCAIFALFYHHICHLSNSSTPLSFSLSLLLLLSDAIFAFMWFTSQAHRLRPVRSHAFPENLPRVIDDNEFPALDVFICTADPYKEPPLSVINTALSAMAFDYPSDKISVYVSDDGGSKLTLFAFVEAAKFAMHWLPYCKDLKIQKRCPEDFFEEGAYGYPSEEWEKMKILYDRMKTRVDSVMEKETIDDEMNTSGIECDTFAKWTAGFSRKDHPTVIEVLLESGNDVDVTGKAMPNLIYLSREKSSTIHHHFKAGSLNVMLRVSALMTNSPLVLTLDCDMYSNDPQAPRRALCYHLEPKMGPELAFVQFPQRFHGINKSDIYGSRVSWLFQIYPSGMDGLRGPCYVGTGTFFSRRAFYTSPSQPGADWEMKYSNDITKDRKSICSKQILDAAYDVAACAYEQGTNWGLTLGFRYGSLVEDFFTGYRLHCEGWRSTLCNPSIPGFLGNVPINLNEALNQVKRWSIGLLEVAFSEYCPLTFGTRRCSVLMGLSYAHLAFWAIWSIPVLTYALLPQLALLTNISLFPKVCDQWFYLYAYLFFTSYIQDLTEHLIYGGTFKRWWNDQRMWMIRGVSSYLFALFEFSLKQVGISGTGFDITSKLNGNEQQERYNREVIDFGVETPMFIPLSTIAIINLASFTSGLMMVLRKGNLGEMFVQLFICGFVMVNCWPIYEGMVLRRDRGKMPTRITLVAVFLGWILYWLATLVAKSWKFDSC